MKRGFTLIELVVSISIVSILFTLGLMSFRRVGSLEAKKDLKTIVNHIKFARNMAISKKSQSQVYFSRDNSYEITCADYKESFHYNNKLQFLNTRDVKLTFTIKGVSSADTSQTLYFKIKDKIYEITVEPITGKVNLKI
ncbi:MAG: type II secretion system protein [Peptoniphilus sp.]|nr:type II secretion system protein [Peptoniphilus sp.]